ncbi:PAQR family membrane homeostasis protein TrhA [Spongiimicrobium salis]|uniref:PAQR family membrane homeostasis protein TrhA n=1 Tax=Spongiimicrobium salis TaxID=1667022 RepID=UPI00374D5DC6
MSQKGYPHEEMLNALSHGVGVVLAIIGTFDLLGANTHKTPYATGSLVIYSLALIILFLASTLYHMAKKTEVKQKLRILDHISIYILIAGTYTPLTLITLLPSSGWTIFYIVWSIAGVGTILKLFFTGRFEYLSLLFYVIMGWLIVLDFDNVRANVSPLGLQLLMLGGGCYTLGIVFYAIRKIPYNHLIWHFFVLGGAIAHFFFIKTLI